MEITDIDLRFNEIGLKKLMIHETPIGQVIRPEDWKDLPLTECDTWVTTDDKGEIEIWVQKEPDGSYYCFDMQGKWDGIQKKGTQEEIIQFMIENKMNK